MSNFVDWSDIDITFKKSKDGTINIVRGVDAIEQSIKIILSTMRGEHVRSDLGTGLYRLLFEEVTEDTAEDMEDLIINNIERFDNRILLRAVRVIPFREDSYYKVEINYTIFPSREKKNLTTFMPALGDN